MESFETHIASRTNWFPGRSAAVLTRFRNEGLFPQTEAPVFSQHGGELSYENPLTLTTDADSIYYTLDGSDPRLFGGTLSPSAIAAILSAGSPNASDPLFFSGPVTLRARSYNSITGEWSALLEAEFTYENPVPERIDLVEDAEMQPIDPTFWFGPPVTHANFLAATTSHPAVASATIDGDGKVLLDGLLRGGTELIVTYNDGENPSAEVRVPVLVYPSAHPLAGGVYQFGEWDAATPAGVFPPHMIFLQGAENDSSLATALDRAYHIPAGDAANAADVDFPYAATSRTRINGLDDMRVANDAGNVPVELVFDSAPAGAQSGAPLPPVVVRVFDASGFPVADFDGPVTLSLLGDGVLTGTLATRCISPTAVSPHFCSTATWECEPIHRRRKRR